MHTSRHLRRTSILTGLAAAVLVLSGCTINVGSTSSTTTAAPTTRTSTSSAPEPTTGRDSIPPEPEESQNRAEGTSVDVTKYLLPESNDFVGFTSPSEQIRCNVGLPSSDIPAFARCDVYDSTYTPPPPPADCDLEWGPSIGIEGFLCVGDAVNPGPVLAYGSSITFGSITCTSREDGVTCIDESKGGRGFRTARGSYDLF